MAKWKWNDVELDIDLEDADFVEKYEKAFNRMGETEKSVMSVGSLTERCKDYCKMFFQLFDDIFGNGTSDKLFKGKMHMGLVDECYESFLTFAKKEMEEANKRRVARVTKLSKYAVKSKR